MAWKEVTENRYMEMLEILPPRIWNAKGFMVGEPWDHTREGFPRFQPLITYQGKFYEGGHPLTVAEFKDLDPAKVAEVAHG